MKERQKSILSQHTRTNEAHRQTFLHNRHNNQYNRSNNVNNNNNNTNHTKNYVGSGNSHNNANRNESWRRTSNKNYQNNIDNRRNINKYHNQYNTLANVIVDGSNVDSSIPSSHVTPFAATQDQPAQHSVAMVRSGMGNTVNDGGTVGSVMFYSSVQKKGGAFTSTEQETYRQLHCKRAIQDRQAKQAGNINNTNNNSSSRTSFNSLHSHSANNIANRFRELQEERYTRDMASAKQAHEKGIKQFRFAIENDSDDEDSNA